MTTERDNVLGYARAGAQGSPSGLLIVDERGRIVVADRTAAGLLGTQRNDLIGRHFGLPDSNGGVAVVDVAIPSPTTEVELHAAPTTFGDRQAWMVVMESVRASGEPGSVGPDQPDPASWHADPGDKRGNWADSLLNVELKRSIVGLEPEGNWTGLVLLHLGSNATGRSADNGAGDPVATAITIRDHIRQDDVIVPLQAEELAVVCNDVSTPGGRSMLDRIRRVLVDAASDGRELLEPPVMVLTRDPTVDSATLVSAGRAAARRAHATNQRTDVCVADSTTHGSATLTDSGQSPSIDPIHDRTPTPRRRDADLGTRTSEVAHARFDSIVDDAADGVVVVDASGVLVFANGAAASMLGHEQEELIGQVLGIPMTVNGTTELELVDPSDPRVVRALEVRAVESQWDGEAAWLLVIRDTSERHAAELELMRTNAHLVRSKADLEETAEHIAHDLGQPFAAIERSLHAIGTQVPGDRGVRHLLDVADQGLRVARELVEGLHEQSRSGWDHLRLETVDSRQVAEECRTLVSGRSGTVTIGQLPLVTTDRRLLRQIFQNLISNGLRHSRPGVDPHVTVAAKPLAAGWLFTVTDNGPGIPHDLWEQVFRPFWSKGSTAGGGIGLAAAERAVLRLGGSIWVESAPEGPGSRFCFTLVTEPVEPTTVSAAAAPTPPGDGLDRN